MTNRTITDTATITQDITTSGQIKLNINLSTANLWTGQQNFSTATLTDGATINWNLNTQQVARVTLGGNRTIANPTNLVDGGTYVLEIVQDATGSRTITWGANYKWLNNGGSAPTLSSTANVVDVLSFMSDGTYMYGVAATHDGTSSGMTYPGSGIANSTGSAWGTSYTTTGSGTVLALATSPTLVTPTLGVATATSINKMAVTAPATSSTLAVADGKTLTCSNTLTLTGTDSSSAAFGGGGTVAYTNVAQSYTAQQNFGTATLTDGATINWNMNTQQVAKVTLGGNRTMAAPSNLVDGGTYILRIIQDGTGSRTLTWNSVFKWPGGTAPTLTTTAAAIDMVTFISDGTNLYGVAQLAFA
jgi:uncharacterized protein (DUF2141 family)